ncbi:MFS transporter [Maribrevibacterium harenarium]|uniref:MFS transporter n=1 Tax=Maribrevibacterium harenarium TaxID=2589817 RepID=A0A501WVS8_9GAMM|nr:MFS transporter [Maribrevibacterium harenarium]TPE49986.1 MFS transporter [Maribrevibacterium harenarium]
MDTIERRSVLALALVYLFRMLGLFLIMPVISIASDGLQGADAALIGTAIGIYGLTQALLQIPMGMMSDKIGRKPIIVGGLILFALGSVIAANATDIYTLIIGRAVQGAGAIASTLMALLSDVTKEQNRTKAMATVGISIGVSFMISLVLGPILFAAIGLSGLFYLSFGFSVVGIALILMVVPTPKQVSFRRDTTPSMVALGRVLTDRSLRYLNFSVLLLHASLTAVFVAVPLVLVQRYGLALGQHSLLYLIVMGLAFIGMLPLVIAAEAKGKMKGVLVIAVALIAASVALFALQLPLWLFAALICLFFVAFNTLEATLPSLVSKQAPVGYRGTAMGAFSTHQFFGAFIGGAGGGWLMGQLSMQVLFFAVAALWFLWFLFTLSQPAPRQLSSIAFTLPQDIEVNITELTEQLANIQGVEDMQIFTDERTAYLKVDKKQLDKAALARIAPQIAL